MGPNEFVASITALAIAMSEGKSSDEIGQLSLFFNQLGVTLASISVTKAANEGKLQI